MALKINFNLKTMPAYAQGILSIVPAVIIVLVVVFLLILPKNKEIKSLETKISSQENEIAKDQAKAAKLPQLTLENERLQKRLTELKQQLPEEKEVSTLLKQVSDLCISAGLKISLWKPEAKRTHSSGIVYEIPVKVELSGSYHNLGYFFSSLTKLNRIVNISEFKLGNAKPDKGQAILKITFTATTFSSVPESEIVVKTVGKPKRGRR
jgi:type IV pilus assembly protein PilO